jgi:hypothetical protein
VNLSVEKQIIFNEKIMQTQTQTKPSALNVRWLEDIIFLLRESEENYQKKWWLSVEESYNKNSKILSYLFNQ